MKRLCTVVLLGLAFASLSGNAFAQDTKTWEGNWVNKKFNTTGPLRCVLKINDDGTWEGTFTGTFQGDPFEYQAVFQAKKSGRTTNLAGTAEIRGAKYECVGQVRGDTLAAQYRATNGYFGQFQLKEAK